MMAQLYWASNKWIIFAELLCCKIMEVAV